MSAKGNEREETSMPLCEATDSVRLYYEDFGDGEALVFICAGVQTHKMWEGQAAGLSDRFRTIAYDWRGTGASDKPRTGYTGDAAAADLTALVENLGAAPAVLIGHGIGSHVALLAAEKRPDLVKALVLASSGPWFCGDRDGIVGGLSDEFMAFMAERTDLKHDRGLSHADAMADLGAGWLFHHPQSDALNFSVLEQALTWPQFVLAEYLKTMREIDHRERLKGIDCPTLIIQGRHDRKQRYEGAVYMRDNIPGARLVTLEESAHMGQVEEINAFNDAVATFVAEQAGVERAA
jgi:pimeloyl-ACP methyl ester carboxylesterase